VIGITWQALLARILATEHWHQVVVKFVNAVLDITVIIDTYLISILFDIFIIFWILNFEVQLNSPFEKFKVFNLSIKIKNKSFKNNLASNKKTNVVYSNVVQDDIAFFNFRIDLRDFLRNQNDDAGFHWELVVGVEGQSDDCVLSWHVRALSNIGSIFADLT
jgi:hypothetical protein